MAMLLCALSGTIRDGAIRVGGVVVVGVAGRIDIPCIVRIAPIRGPEAAVLSSAYIPIFLYLSASDALQARIRFLVSITFFDQNATRFPLK